jgi:hypothetical protein
MSVPTDVRRELLEKYLRGNVPKNHAEQFTIPVVRRMFRRRYLTAKNRSGCIP